MPTSPITSELGGLSEGKRHQKNQNDAIWGVKTINTKATDSGSRWKFFGILWFEGTFPDGRGLWSQPSPPTPQPWNRNLRIEFKFSDAPSASKKRVLLSWTDFFAWFETLYASVCGAKYEMHKIFHGIFFVICSMVGYIQNTHWIPSVVRSKVTGAFSGREK